MTAQPPRPSVPRSSFAAALKDYTFIRPGIAVSISAACLIAALIIGVFLIGSLKRATAIVDLARRTVFTLHGYNAALQTWQQLVVTEDPELKKPESRALRDRIRSALTGELQKLGAAALERDGRRCAPARRHRCDRSARRPGADRTPSFPCSPSPGGRPRGTSRA